ncbi:hypothetical protein Taro_010186 [Colocasia esculenta]|uniref:Bifunctional inhibitor/plant lipid transfer protein/seed storage helical domain-containing protein n=1 Tax=Colocasia esculenta TaxID=4460 RepID=A0A843U2K6_COLES|nr:hypothetical protein [Colocasia esculenta]
MDFSGTKRLLLAALLLTLALGSASGTDICNMTENDLRECKPAVTAPDPPPPTPACCAGLNKADLPCLCSYRESLLLPALGIDPDLAMQLPAKCGLTPPTEC